MLKSPIDRFGKIRLLEVFKLSVITGFFSISLGALLQNNTQVIGECGILWSIIINITLLIKISTMLYILLIEIKDILDSIKSMFRYLRIWILTNEQLTYVNSYISILFSRDIYLVLGVIRN